MSENLTTRVCDPEKCKHYVVKLIKQLNDFTNSYAFKYPECHRICDKCPYELNGEIYKLNNNEIDQMVGLFDSLSITPENIIHKETLDSSQKVRLMSEHLDSYRTLFHKEEERIIFTNAFRRLQYKTQVMINSASDDQRTRLLHSLEVQKIGRKIAVALKANVELVETITIAHDIGHTPFGHAGEDAIKQYLEENLAGSFSHALQGVKVVDFLCTHKVLGSMGLQGLGVSDYVLEGILKHDTDSFSDNLASAAFRLQYECPNLYKPVGVSADSKEYVKKRYILAGLKARLPVGQTKSPT